MIIEIDQGSGFCFGVTTAIEKAEETLKAGHQLSCLGDIVHNGMECERLRNMGLDTIGHDEFACLHDATVLLRAHGEPPATYEMARRNRINIIDATCPVVLALQKRIKKKYEMMDKEKNSGDLYKTIKMATDKSYENSAATTSTLAALLVGPIVTALGIITKIFIIKGKKALIESSLPEIEEYERIVAERASAE